MILNVEIDMDLFIYRLQRHRDQFLDIKYVMLHGGSRLRTPFAKVLS